MLHWLNLLEMKIIFLDFDGVLNSENWYKILREKPDQEERYPLDEFDPSAIWRLNKIVQETGAQVVVSSTWRKGREIDELQSILDEAGFMGKVFDKTPVLRDMVGNSYTVPRGCEIDYWLKNSGKFQRINWSIDVQEAHLEKSIVKNYIILDDDSDMLYNQKEHYIKISTLTGLTDENVNNAISILNTPLVKLYYVSNS